MRDPGNPQDDVKEAVEILTTMKDLFDAEILVYRELADDALTDAAHMLWRSGPLDDLITRAAKLYWPRTHIE
jgi:hypothetical protein